MKRSLGFRRRWIVLAAGLLSGAALFVGSEWAGGGASAPIAPPAPPGLALDLDRLYALDRLVLVEPLALDLAAPPAVASGLPPGDPVPEPHRLWIPGMAVLYTLCVPRGSW